MTAALRQDDPTPLYHRLFVILRNRIRDGEIARGELLPGEQELAARYGVSRITAKRALDELAAAGLVERRRGRGTIVTHDYRPAPIRAPIAGLLDTLEIMGTRSSVRRVALGACPAPPAVALRLGVAPGEPLLHARRVRAVDGVAFALLDSYTRWPQAAPLEADGLAATGRLERFRRAGVRIASAAQVFSAGLADETVAGLLGVAAGDALLHLERTLHADDGKPFDHLVARYVPERFEYRMELSGTESFAGGAPADPPAPAEIPETDTR